MPNASPSVLVIRLDAIGDALALTPLLAALRARAIPADLVLAATNAGIFSRRAARRVFTAPFAARAGGAANLEAIAGFGAELAGGYTHVLVATEDPGGYRLARAVRAPVRIGFSNGWGKPLKTLWSRAFLTAGVYRSAALASPAPHECAVLFRLGEALLGDAAPTRDARELRPLVLDREPVADPRIAIQITDKWERLGIPLSQVVETVERLRWLGPTRAIASERERAYAERVEAAAGIEVERFAELAPWKAAIGAAAAIVAPDSGALHVAGMVGTPVVAVFPANGAFALQTARWSPWAAPHGIVRAGAGWPARAAEALAQLRVSGTA